MNTIKVNKLHSLTGHRDCVYSIVSGKNSTDLFSAGSDGTVALWNMESPETAELIAKLSNSIYALHYLPHQDQLVVAQNFQGIHLLDHTAKKELGSLKISKDYIFDLQSHEDKLFVASGDGSVSVVNLSNLKIIDQLVHTQKSARTMAISRARSELAVGYSDHYIRIFDLTNHQLKYEWKAHANSVFTLCYSPDSRFLLTGSRDAHLKVWDANLAFKNALDIVAHMYTINHITFSPDNKHFVTCSMDKSIKVWDSEGFKLLKVIDKTRHAGHGTSVNKLAWTSFNNQLASASDDRTISIWEIIF